MKSPNTVSTQEIAFVRILIPFSMGIVTFYPTEKSEWLNALILTNTVFFVCLIVLKLLLKKHRIKFNNGSKGLIIHIFFFFIGGLSCTLNKTIINSDYQIYKEYKYLKIRISDEPTIRQNIILFTAKIAQSTCKKHTLNWNESHKSVFQHSSEKIRVRIQLSDTLLRIFEYGDELIIPAKLSAIPAPLNPSEFDFKSWLMTKNVFRQTFLKPNQIIKLNRNTGNSLLLQAIRLRQMQVNTFRNLIKNDDAFAIAATLILGYRADLSPEILDIYSKTGTIHALSVSGMHVGLLYIVLSRMLWLLNKNRHTRILKTILILTVIWFYTVLTGFSPSVLRAALMISVFIIAKLHTKLINSYNVLAFTAFSLLCFDPFLLWDVGFQLSFMAVLGLIYLEPKIQSMLPIKQPILAKVWSAAAMSIAAQLATYPFSIYYFHQFPIYFLASNLFLAVPAALMMYLGVIILILNAHSLAPLFEQLIIFTNSGLNTIAQLPFSGINAIWLSKTELIILCLALTSLIVALDTGKKRVLFFSCVALFCLQTSFSLQKFHSYRQKKVIKFSLKLNYAVAAISGRQALLFTDLKRNSKAYNYSVRPALDQHGVTRIILIPLNVNKDLKDNLIFD